jgi:hypothetical protein
MDRLLNVLLFIGIEVNAPAKAGDRSGNAICQVMYAIYHGFFIM